MEVLQEIRVAKFKNDLPVVQLAKIHSRSVAEKLIS
jgi:hypothetical protein